MTGHPAVAAGVAAGMLLAASACLAGCDGADLPWRTLRLQARKALLTGHVEVQARSVAASDPASGLMHGSEADERAAATECVTIIQIVARLPFKGTSVDTSWIDGDGLLQWESRNNERVVVWRAGASGVHEWRRKPKGRRSGSDPAAWPLVADRHLDWAAPPGEGPLLDAGAILLLLSRSRFDRDGASLTGVAWSKGCPVRVTAQARGVTTLPRSARSHADATTRRVELSGARRCDDASDAGGFGLMGLQGPVEVFLEAGTALPLEIRGALPHWGQIRIRLEASN